MEPRESGIDNVLRRSLAGPIPTLPADFDQRVMREVRRSSQPLDRYRRIFLTGYGIVSALTCAVVMRGQGIDWAPIAGLIAAPLVMVAAARLTRVALRPR